LDGRVVPACAPTPIVPLTEDDDRPSIYSESELYDDFDSDVPGPDPVVYGLPGAEGSSEDARY
jgi:hypothetical protein